MKSLLFYKSIRFSLSLISLITLTSYGQNYRKLDRYLNDNNVKFLISAGHQGDIMDLKMDAVLEKGISLGYSIVELADGSYFFPSPTGGNIFSLEKNLRDDRNNGLTPSNAIGYVFMSYKIDANGNSNIYKVITQIRIIEWEYMRSSAIKEYFDNVITVANYWNSKIYSKESEEKVLNIENLEGLHLTNYPLVTKQKLVYTLTEDGKDYDFDAYFYTGRSSEIKRTNEGKEIKVNYLLMIREHSLEEAFANMFTTINSNNSENQNKILDDQYLIEGIDIREYNTYNVGGMIDIFIKDALRFGIEFPFQEIKAIFKPLEENVLAVSLGMDQNDQVIIHVNPDLWDSASESKKWYIIYHELGHDLLNLDHGEGGEMMFNYSQEDYSWKDFLEGRESMFVIYKSHR